MVSWWVFGHWEHHDIGHIGDILVDPSVDSSHLSFWQQAIHCMLYLVFKIKKKCFRWACEEFFFCFILKDPLQDDLNFFIHLKDLFLYLMCKIFLIFSISKFKLELFVEHCPYLMPFTNIWQFKHLSCEKVIRNQTDYFYFLWKCTILFYLFIFIYWLLWIGACHCCAA